GGGVGLQALVGDRVAAADGLPVGAVVQAVQGALDGVQPVAQALRDGVVHALGGQRRRGVGGVARLAVHLGDPVGLAGRLGVLQQALHLVTLGGEQAACALGVHRAFLPVPYVTRGRPGDRQCGGIIG